MTDFPVFPVASTAISGSLPPVSAGTDNHFHGEKGSLMSLVTRFTIASMLGATVVSSAAYAAPIAAGQTAYAVFENNPVGGVSISQTQPFATANYTGSLISTVITGDTSNPLGGLTFTYQLVNDAGSANALTRLTVNGFNGFFTDLSYKLGTGGLAPTSNDRDGSSAVIGFSFTGAPLGAGTLSAGTTSELLVVQTNAQSYQTRIANVSNGAVSPVNAFGPASVTSPEPATLATLIGGATLLRRRRRA
jgi:hypothetical protein